MISAEESMLFDDDFVDRDSDGKITDYKRLTIVNAMDRGEMSKETAARLYHVTIAEIDDALAWWAKGRNG